MFYSILGKIGRNFSKIKVPNQKNLKKIIIFFPIDEDSFRVALYSFRKFNFYNSNIEYFFIINQKFQDLIKLDGPNIVYVSYNKNKINWINNDGQDKILDNIDVVVDLNSEFYFDLAKLINQLDCNLKIGFKSIYSDYFYNIQIDLGKSKIIENGFDKIQKILIS